MEQQQNSNPQASSTIGETIRQITEQLQRETSLQIHATAQILGAAAQIAVNHDRLIDEVVELVEEDLNKQKDCAVSVQNLKQQFKTFAKAKAHYGIKTRSWVDLANQLNRQTELTSNPSSQPVPLIDALQTTRQRSNAVFCTPGHKLGQSIPQSMEALIGNKPFQADFPDLPGFNLYEPDGVIVSAQSLAAETFGADRTWFLVNGSTVGIIAAILATCHPGEKIILPRNSHISAISGLILSGAHPIFLRPEYDPHWDLAHCITPQSVAMALNVYPETKAILMVSPTYHGVCGDVEAIATLAHQHNIPLIVDEAHGAHFGFHHELPRSALDAGADVVIQSTHKTLSALTQSSMLHLRGNRVEVSRITQALQLLQSSSPSNLLLASLDGARHQIATQGEKWMSHTLLLAHQAREQLQSIQGLSVLRPKQAITPGFCQLDLTRLTIDVSSLGIDGFTADEILTEQFGITAELPTQRHLTFIISLGSTEVDIIRLIQSLQELARMSGTIQPIMQPTEEELMTVPVRSPRDAFFAKKESVPISDAIGRIGCETICPYPPGIPILLPGEVITEAAIAQIQAVQLAGGLVTGCADASLQSLQVIRL